MLENKNLISDPELQYNNEVLGKIVIERCDFLNHEHCENLVKLTNIFMTDPEAGCGRSLSHAEEENLIFGLAEHPTTFILFAKYNDQYVGLITCFIGFSTFKAKKLIQVHDIVVHPDFRGKGIAKKMMKTVEDTAVALRYCKITIEVRDDNTFGKKLMNTLGDTEVKSTMIYRTKEINNI
ncbi:MAG: GNAT family N-acetyltransferase [Fibrobacterales bacterium]